jgi:hypothetical protein
MSKIMESPLSNRESERALNPALGKHSGRGQNLRRHHKKKQAHLVGSTPPGIVHAELSLLQSACSTEIYTLFALIETDQLSPAALS